MPHYEKSGQLIGEMHWTKPLELWSMTASGRRFPAGFVRRRLTALVLAAFCLGGGMFMVLKAGTAAEKTRGVRLLEPGEEMKPAAPMRQEPPIAGPNGSPIAAVRVAVAGGQSGKLDGMAAREVPFELVPPSANPELVWDAASHTAAAGQTVIAFKVEQSDLPAIIDRTAAVRTLKELAASKPQIVRVSPAAETRHRGDKVEVDIENVANRALVLFNIAGDGTVQALYPLGSDPPVLEMNSYHLTMQIREPFGTDVLVAVTAAQTMDRLEQGLKQISRFQSAGQALRLVMAAAPDARIGLVTLSSVP